MHFILGIFVYGYFYVDVYFMLFKIIAPMQKKIVCLKHTTFLCLLEEKVMNL